MSMKCVRGLATLVLALCATTACAGKEAPTDGSGGPPQKHLGYFAAPSGSSRASGSESNPWDLTTALSGGGGRIQPGDTIWLRAGTYAGSFTSTLSGSRTAPIIVRQYPGERATIDGSIRVEGRNVWFWGFEVGNTDVGTQDITGIDSHCPGCRFINLVIHDHSGNGLGMWAEGPDQEAYGNILYNNGFRGQSADHSAHGIYGQNRTGTQIIRDNVLFNQFGYGVHIYGSNQAALNNYIIDGNTAFNNGVGQGFGMSGGMDYQVGGEAPLEKLVFIHNNSYRSSSLRRDFTARIGYDWGPLNYGGTVTDNYFVGELRIIRWGSLNSQRNVVIDGPTPAQTRALVQPNEYEAARANVIIYNWDHQGAISIDLAGVLRPGQHFEIRDVEDFYGLPVVSGTYDGGSVSIPLTGTRQARSITGKSTAATGAEFAALVVIGE